MDKLMSHIDDFITIRIESDIEKLKSHQEYNEGERILDQVFQEIKGAFGDNALELIHNIENGIGCLLRSHQERAYIQGFKDALNFHKL